MDDLSRRIDALSARLRVQTLVTFGALAILVFAAGGADVVAKAMVPLDGWTLQTKDASGTLIPRLTAETDVNVAQLKVKSSNLFLEKQLTQPFTPASAEGALWYDDTANRLKVSNGSTWAEPGGLIFVQKITVAANTNNVSFAGLDGDQDGIYVLQMRIKSNSGHANDLFRLKPNGVTTQQISRGWICSNTNTFAGTGYTDMTLNRTGSASATGNQFMFTVTFHARRAVGATIMNRTFVSQFYRFTPGGAESGGASGAWTDTGALLISLMVESHQPNGVGIGSEFTLYKLSGS